MQASFFSFSKQYCRKMRRSSFFFLLKKKFVWFFFIFFISGGKAFKLKGVWTLLKVHSVFNILDQWLEKRKRFLSFFYCHSIRVFS